MMRLLLHIGVFVLLTILTQIGGIAYLGALWISRGFWRRSLLFLGLYTLVTISTIFIAPIFGRQALPCFQEDGLSPRSLTYCAMNRQYVAPELHRLTGNLARYVLAKHPGHGHALSRRRISIWKWIPLAAASLA